MLRVVLNQKEMGGLFYYCAEDFTGFPTLFVLNYGTELVEC